MFDDEKPGYGRPPRDKQFKKGQPSANPKGRPKSEPIDVIAFFEETVLVPRNGRNVKMAHFEVSLTNLALKAIKGDLRAAEKFLSLCAECGLLTSPTVSNGWPQMLRIPKDYDADEWNANLDRLGPPPWPGEHDGLPRLNLKWTPRHAAG